MDQRELQKASKAFSGTAREFGTIVEHLKSTERVDGATLADDLLRDAEAALELLRAGQELPGGEPLRRQQRSPEVEIGIELDDYTREYGEVFGEVAAAMAATHPGVVCFREALPNKTGLLSREEAEDVLLRTNAVGVDLKKLRGLARSLAKYYRWREEDAAWFVLTGDEPPVFLISATIHKTDRVDEYYPQTARITITADPSVDARVLGKVYSAAQRQLNGGDNRELSRKTLDVARFVARQIKEGNRESWQKLTDRWNRENREHPDPKRRYGSRGGLRSVFEKFWHPKYLDPRWKPYEPTPYQTARDNLNRELFQELKQRPVQNWSER